MIRALFVTAAAALLIAEPAAAQTWPKRIPTADGEVIIPTQGDQRGYDAYRYAPARRVGDTLYISGVIVFRGEKEGRDEAAFKDQSRRAFRRLQTILEASGAKFSDVTMINSFHVWNSPEFEGTRDQQFAAFQTVMDEFMDPPWPAWTAVGTTGLLADTGIIEVQMIARVPLPAK